VKPYLLDDFRISQDKLTAILKWYKVNGLQPRRKKSGGRILTKRILSFQDIEMVVQFLLNYAEANAIVLPGRIATFHRWDVKVLPSSVTKSSVWRLYKEALPEGRKAVGNSTFRKLWQQLVPNLVITKPRTDICWECHQNNTAIYRSSNLPEAVKSAKLKKQQQHLATVGVERDLYRAMVSDCKASVAAGTVLAQNAACSRSEVVHYSFDFAQQVHYPFDAMQPGPMYFLCPRKCGVFGICCEGIPQQVNFLIDEGHCCSKGSNAVISYLDYFFANYGLGETTVHLHCDNCSGQNKNRYMLWYLLWRCCLGLHHDITLNFLVTGHTKFAPDWCFGLFKQTFRRSSVSCLDDIASVLKRSTVSGVNVPQLVGSESGETFVPCRNWQQLLDTYFRTLPKIKSYHHFRFTSSKPGVVFVKEFHDSPEIECDLLVGKAVVSTDLPDIIPAPGLDNKRQWYLFNQIRDFCRESVQDVVCPKPTITEPLPDQEPQPEPSTSTPVSVKKPQTKSKVSHPSISSKRAHQPSISGQSRSSLAENESRAVKKHDNKSRKVVAATSPSRTSSDVTTRSGRQVRRNVKFT